MSGQRYIVERRENQRAPGGFSHDVVDTETGESVRRYWIGGEAYAREVAEGIAAKVNAGEISPRC